MQDGGQRELDQSRPKIGLLLILTSCLALISVVFSIWSAPVAEAATTVPTKMNFQGRLTDSTGKVMPDGTYNMKFRLYDAATGGTVQWSETREVSASTGVQVDNGLFSVRLGDVTSLPASLFNNTNLYFEIELPTPATATCSTASCAVYTEGPMTPRNPVATSAYAFNADTVDGIDGDNIAVLDQNNTYTGSNFFGDLSADALSIGFESSFNGQADFYDNVWLLSDTTSAVDSVTAFHVQDTSANALFNVDTVGAEIQIGSSTADANAVVFILDVSNSATDPATAANGSMYYNSSMGKFRCYEAGAWKDCDTGGSVDTTNLAKLDSANTFVANNTFEGSVNVNADDGMSGFSVNTNGQTSVYVMGFDAFSATTEFGGTAVRGNAINGGYGGHFSSGASSSGFFQSSSASNTAATLLIQQNGASNAPLFRVNSSGGSPLVAIDSLGELLTSSLEVQGSTLFGSDVSLAVDSNTAFTIQNSSAAALFTADTNNMAVTIGTAANGISFTANGVVYSGTARPTNRIQLTPEYAGAVLDAGTGIDNSGSMTAGYNATARMNYYQWTTTEVAPQTYDVVVQVPLPNDFDGFASNNPLRISTYSSNLTTGQIDLELRDSTNASILSFVPVTPTTVDSWQVIDPGDISSGTYSAGDYITLRIRLQADSASSARVGNITLDYLARF